MWIFLLSYRYSVTHLFSSFVFLPNCFGCRLLTVLVSPTLRLFSGLFFCISCWNMPSALVTARRAVRSEAEVQSDQWGAWPCSQWHDLFVICTSGGARGPLWLAAFPKLFSPVIPVTSVQLPQAILPSPLWELSSIKTRYLYLSALGVYFLIIHLKYTSNDSEGKSGSRCRGRADAVRTGAPVGRGRTRRAGKRLNFGVPKDTCGNAKLLSALGRLLGGVPSAWLKTLGGNGNSEGRVL